MKCVCFRFPLTRAYDVLSMAIVITAFHVNLKCIIRCACGRRLNCFNSSGLPLFLYTYPVPTAGILFVLLLIKIDAMPNPVGRPPKGSKRKAQSLTTSTRASKRSRTATKPSTKSSTTSSHPKEAYVPFPADVTTGEVHLTDIALNDDATVTCNYAFKGMGNMATYVHLGSAFGECVLRCRNEIGWVEDHSQD